MKWVSTHSDLLAVCIPVKQADGSSISVWRFWRWSRETNVFSPVLTEFDQVGRIEWSTDGHYLALQNQDRLYIFDLDTYTTIAEFIDEAIVLAAVHKTGVALWRKFGIDATPLDSSIDAFKRVMYGPGAIKIQFTRNGSGFECVTINRLPDTTNQVQAIINCPLSVILSEHTIVHELGHVLIGRTGGYEQFQNGKPTYFRLTEREKIVDPTDPLFVIFGELSSEDWRRGSRGWGSSAGTKPDGSPCSFQQNPRMDPGETDEEIDEGAADMFLNWVYRKNNPADGFKNTEWLNALSCDFGLIDTDPSGDLRFNWVETQLQTLGTDRGW